MLGYGLIFFKIINIDIKRFNLGYAGLGGIFFLTLISYATNLFLPHDVIHNSIIHIVGFTFFIFLYRKSYSFFKASFLRLLVIILIFLSGLFLSKNNEDFPYYHLSFAMQLVEHKLQFGISHFNTAFRAPSSLFYLNSLFYLPYIKYYLFHASGLIILVLFNFIVIEQFFFNKFNKDKKFIKIFSILTLIYINSSFNRLAEYGTDKAGQIIIFLIFILLFDILTNGKFYLEKIKLLLILIFYIISIKSYFYSYLILLPIIGYLSIQKNILKILLIDFKFLLIFFLFVFLLLFSNLSNTGCLIYPLSITCFENLFWSVSIESVNYYNTWYELWAKSGATPNLRVNDPDLYIKSFNWVPNWFKNYFFTKVSDHLLIIATIIIYCRLIFVKEDKKNYKNNKINTSVYLYVLVLVIFLLQIWFFKHPDLRYGGYSLSVMLFFISTTIFFIKYDFNNKKKIFITILITIVIFNAKNILRIMSEFKRDDIYKYTNFPFFHIENVNYKEVIVANNTKVFLVETPMCWATPSPCVGSIVDNKKINSYLFFFKKIDE
jgi:hypothetical protein